MGQYCSTCGKKFDNDAQKFCPNCGALRVNTGSTEEKPGAVPTYVQNDPKSVRASTMRRQFEERNPEPKKKGKLGFWTKLIGTALILYGLTILFPYGCAFVCIAFFTMLFVRHGDSKPISKGALESLDTDMD